ncbi:hypothetical protein ACVK00_000988 [Burkholderia sp. PvR073]
MKATEGWERGLLGWKLFDKFPLGLHQHRLTTLLRFDERDDDVGRHIETPVQRIDRKVPPSTRTAAPLDAAPNGLASNATMAAISSASIMRAIRELGR